MLVRPLIVAIDGPSGAGKSATARGLAARLGVPYLDTGAMYRAMALAVQRAGLTPPWDSAAEAAAIGLAERSVVELSTTSFGQRVLLDGEDVTELLRTPEISRLASVVSACPGVRRVLVARQRELASARGGVVEGRDIGTVVFPDATVKIYLTAAPEVRATRRLFELQGRGVAVAREDVVAEQRERDFRDANRQDSPLRPAAGAAVIDSSAMSLDAVIVAALEVVRRALDTQREAPV